MDISQSDPLLLRLFGTRYKARHLTKAFRRHPHPVITYRYPDLFLVPFNVHLDMHAFFLILDPVDNGILDQWLDNQRRYPDGADFRIDR
ncbi:hypothetical protein D3C81_1242940 [compost metagenome]